VTALGARVSQAKLFFLIKDIKEIKTKEVKNMKPWEYKAVSVVLCIGMCFSMSGCKNNDTESKNTSKYTGSI
jgi:hypothetical protein